MAWQDDTTSGKLHQPTEEPKAVEAFGSACEKTLVCLPTYNEIENVELIVRAVLEAAPVDVLVIDDNSPDGTGRKVEELMKSEPRLKLLSRAGKQGLAQAYIAGFGWAIASGYERIVEMDADFSHRPSDLPRLLEALDAADLAIGCRYVDGGGTKGWSKLREGISRGGNWYAQKVLSLPYRDLTGGFNAWKREVLERIDYRSLRSRGYAFQVELKYRTHLAGFRMKEVPIQFDDRRHGKSKMSGRIVWEAAFRVLQMRGQQIPESSPIGVGTEVPA